MKSKSRKSEELKKLETKIPESSIVIFTSFSRKGEKGLSVAQMQELKRAMRALGSEYFVVKKTLIDKAIKDLKYDGVDVFKMGGSMGVILGGGDGYALAKKMNEFAKKNQALQYFGAIFESKFLGADALKEMALMPSREVLLGRLLGMMKYPVSALVITLGQIVKQKEVAV